MTTLSLKHGFSKLEHAFLGKDARLIIETGPYAIALGWPPADTHSKAAYIRPWRELLLKVVLRQEKWETPAVFTSSQWFKC